MNNDNLIRIVKEEIKIFSEQNQLTSRDISEIVDKVIRKLDSIDMSLDLIYGALIDSDEPISVTRARQAAFGRLASPRRRREPAK